MPPRSMTNQVAQLQKEVTPGVPLVTAMKRLQGIKLMPGYNVDGSQGFKASGYKVNTSYQIGDIWSMWTVDGIQDFNALGYVLASYFGPPNTTPNATDVGAFSHVFSMNPAAVDPLLTYTAQWGDNVKAFQASYFAFQSLTLGIERGNLSFGSSGISRKQDKGATLASTGVTSVTSVPIPQRGYDVYADDTWLTLGTTKLLAAYSAEITNPDKFVPDRPINSQVDGYETLMEADDMDFAGKLTVGFDTTGAALVDSFENEALKFFRFAVNGPIIAGATRYGLKYDIAARLSNVGEVTSAPNSPTVVLPFDLSMIADPTSGKFQSVTLVNSISSY